MGYPTGGGAMWPCCEVNRGDCGSLYCCNGWPGEIEFITGTFEIEFVLFIFNCGSCADVLIAFVGL
jgi:hypothetical protein